MSIVAEFAARLHEHTPSQEGVRSLSPIRYDSKIQKARDIKAVIFDVYGTLVNYWRTVFTDKESRLAYLMETFRMTADYFEMTPILQKMNPEESPAKTLHDFYHGLIALDHEKSLRKKIDYPEVKIEKIWKIIIMMLMRHGYTTEDLELGDIKDVSRCVAFFYNFHALGRGFYPGVVETLRKLREQNMRLGIVSNAQFYTPIDLTLFVRDQSNNDLDDYRELFDESLVFYSCEHGTAKPGTALFSKLYDAFHQMHILPSQTVYVGNDLVQDIKPAGDAGMCTAFFTGDKKSAFMHDMEGRVIPDISFAHWDELPQRISFYEGES